MAAVLEHVRPVLERVDRLLEQPIAEGDESLPSEVDHHLQMLTASARAIQENASQYERQVAVVGETVATGRLADAEGELQDLAGVMKAGREHLAASRRATDQLAQMFKTLPVPQEMRDLVTELRRAIDESDAELAGGFSELQEAQARFAVVSDQAEESLVAGDWDAVTRAEREIDAGDYATEEELLALREKLRARHG